ncbi:CCDC158 family protein [Helicobacter salomonis]|uniref:hypothetical protein n=1 Tax=Helicobacter salomonis TaxID=56878 RepID=UPI0018F85A49|nr:hypothetical protein [Helicobacter salomonis]
MGALSSIHFKPTKHDIQEKHNDRTIAPNYILKSGGLGIECNHNALEARTLRDRLVEQAKLHYKQHVNQPFKAKSYLWSAVVNLKDTSTMQDLERLANHFKDKYGFQCYQIAIHRDEGHVDENGVLHLNHHAHLEFVTLDEKTGRSLFRKVTPKVLRQFQDEVAQILGMERGEYVEKSGRKRIEPRAYGALMEKAREERKSLQHQVIDDLNAHHRAREKQLVEDAQNTLVQAVNKIQELQDSNSNLTQEVNALRDQCDAYCRELESVINATLVCMQTDILAVCKEAGVELSSDGNLAEKDIAERNAILEAVISFVRQHIDELNSSNIALGQANQALKTSNTALATILIDLSTLPAPKGKKLTSKEAKALAGESRKQMIAINQSLGEHKLFTQQDYMAVHALMEQGLTFESFSHAMAQIEQEAKERYEKALEAKEQELKQEHTKDLVARNTEHTQAVQTLKDRHSQEINNLEAQHLENLNSLCTLVGLPSKNSAQASRESLASGIQQLKSDKANLEGQLQTKEQEHTQALQVMQNKIDSLENNSTQKDTTINALKAQITQHTQELDKMKLELETLKTNADTLQRQNDTQTQAIKQAQEANTKLQQANQALEATQQSLTQELESSKQEITTLKTAKQELQQENLKLKPVYLTQAQIRARRLAERQNLMGKGCPKEAFRELSTLDNEKLTQAQLDARVLNIWLKYAPSYIADLENTQANLEQENQTLATELKSVKAEAKSQAHIKVFEKEAVHLIRKHVAPVTTGVVAHIQASGEKITAIHQQCQEEMIQQASVCVVFGEELKAGKFKAFNNVKKLFGKGVKDPITYEYVERGKIHYRELNRREQAIKDTLADTLNKHSQAVQTINNQACQVILEAVESVKDGIRELATEFKNSAEYGAELNQAKRQIDSLENDKERLQNKVSALEKEKETNKQEVEKARANNEAFRKSGVENTRLRNDLQTVKTKLETTQADLEATRTKLESTQSALQALQQVIKPEATPTLDVSKTIDATQSEPTKGHRPKI